MIHIPAPYRRKYTHTGKKGRESVVRCSFCGRNVPRWKSFVTYRGFRITDPVIKRQIDMRRTSMFQRKEYVCPSCARFRGIIKIGRSRKSRTSGR